MSGRVAMTYGQESAASAGHRSVSYAAVRPGHKQVRYTSERGASLSMALLFILVAATVGFIIVTAASVLSGRAASTGSVSREAADQRQYVLRSVARLVEDELVGDHGAYVCIETVEQSGANSSSETHLASGMLASGNAPSFVQGAAATNPSTALEYLAWQASGFELNETFAGKGKWNIVGVGPMGRNVYQLDFVITFAGSDLENWIASTNDLAGTTLDLLCRLTADESLNITAEIGYFTGNVSNVGTLTQTGYGFEKPSENLVFTLPSTVTEYPEVTDVTAGDNPTTTTTNRIMYVWNRA